MATPHEAPTAQGVEPPGRETHAAIRQPGATLPSFLLQLLALAQRHGIRGPAAALHTTVLAASAVTSLQNTNSLSRSDGRGGANSGRGSDELEALRRATAWLADVAADAATPEPAARAALAGLADVLTAALHLLLAAPPGVAPAPVAAAAAALYEPCCEGARLAAVAISALYGRCPDAAAVAAAAKLLGCCLQLQLLLPPPPPLGAPTSRSAATAPTAATPSMPPPPAAPHASAALAARALPHLSQGGATGSKPSAAMGFRGEATSDHRPVGLSEAVGWLQLLDLRRHPHPLVRTACLRAVQLACCAAARGGWGGRFGTAASAPLPTPLLLDPAAAAAGYAAAVGCLEDDAEEPRAAAASLVAALAALVPELPYGTHFGVAARLVDDAFMRLCGLVADPQRGLRLQALRAVGELHAASLRVKLQALSKKTTLRVAAPPAAPQAPAAARGPAGAVCGNHPGGKEGPKRAAAEAAAAATTTTEAGAAACPAGVVQAKRLTASAWEPQSWLSASATRRASAPGAASGPTRPGGGGGGGGSGGGASDDLTLLENAVGAFVLGSEDEHWEVRVAALDAMTRLAEYEYQEAASAAVAAAAAAAAAVGGTAACAPGRGRGSGTAAGLSVRIGGIGGSAGSRIAAGGGNAEAAAAICEALVDALLDELPEVRRAAACDVARLVWLEAEARKKLAAVEPPSVPLAPEAGPAAVPRRSLPPLLPEQLVRALVAAARDIDGATRRAVVRCLGRLRLSRPALLREVVQALCRCVASHPSTADWRAAAAAAWRIGTVAPAAAAASMRDLSPVPEELVATAPPPPTATLGKTGDGSDGASRGGGGGMGHSIALAEGLPMVGALRQLRSETVLRLLVLAGAHVVQPDAVTAALPPHLSGSLLTIVGRLFRP